MSSLEFFKFQVERLRIWKINLANVRFYDLVSFRNID